MKRFDMNNYVKIKLNEFGIKILKCEHDDLVKRFANNPAFLKTLGEFKPPEVDENGYTNMQLYQVMNTFGKYVAVGSENSPFESTAILISEEYLHDQEKSKSL